MRCGIDAEALVDRGDQGFLSRAVGRGNAVAGAVLVDARAADHAVDGITIGHGIRKPLQDDHADALGEDRAIGRMIEGVAAPVGLSMSMAARPMSMFCLSAANTPPASARLDSPWRRLSQAR